MDKQLEQELIQQSREGDWAAFKTLVQQHEGRIAGVVRSLLGTTPEAEDIGQEVFVRFYKALPNFRGDAQVSTYLIRIAVNLSCTELKKRRRRNLLFTSLGDEDPGSDPGSDKDLQERLQAALNGLDPEFKSVVVLRLVEGYDTEETATLLDVPVGTVLSRLSRALKKLRHKLNADL